MDKSTGIIVATAALVIVGGGALVALNYRKKPSGARPANLVGDRTVLVPRYSRGGSFLGWKGLKMGGFSLSIQGHEALSATILPQKSENTTNFWDFEDVEISLRKDGMAVVPGSPAWNEAPTPVIRALVRYADSAPALSADMDPYRYHVWEHVPVEGVSRLVGALEKL